MKHASLFAFAALGASACTPGGGGNAGPGANCVQFPTAPACLNVTHPPDVTDDTSGPGDTDTVQCTASCAGHTCGPDGCGGFCGACGAGMACQAGVCAPGECGAGGVVVSGQLAVGQGIAFDKSTIQVVHKMDIDAFEDGCLTSIVIELGKGFGCTLRIEAGTATAPGGGLRVTNLSFAADSQCPGFPDESEGQYVDFSRMKVMRVVSGVDKVSEKNAPESCLTTNFEVQLEGVLADGAGKTLNVAPTVLRVSGEVKSTGSTTASCPCQASCDGKSCGEDGCGFSCGVCDDNEACSEAGQCVCIPQCQDDQECGPDGCGGTCGSCGQFEACESGSCIACTPHCDGKNCGDDQCGGTCGSCEGTESCNASGQCACGNASCGGVCCGTSDVCKSNACCTPQCDGKACGPDGCGGVCGDCQAGQTCSAAGQCSCTPQCNGKECGSNGCGGTCGSCGDGETCNASGQCTGGSQCVQSSFNAVSESATDNTTYIEYDGLSSTSTNFDGLLVQVWPTAEGWPMTSQGVFDISADNFGTCVVCVLVADGCNASGCGNAKKYLASEGLLTVTEFDPTTGGGFHATLSDAILKEVTLDANGASTWVQGGGQWCLKSGLELGPVTIQAP